MDAFRSELATRLSPAFSPCKVSGEVSAHTDRVIGKMSHIDGAGKAEREGAEDGEEEEGEGVKG